jgi:HlyD family secretion protein
MKTLNYWVALTLVFTGACSDHRERLKPTLSTITESVYASGTVKAAGQYSAFSTVSGIVADLWVQAGDTVGKGQVLMRLENQTARLHTEDARLALELSHENSRRQSGRLRELELQVSQARGKYQLDSSLYFRQLRLWEQQIGSRLDLEQKQLAFITGRNHYQAARSALAQQRTQVRIDLQRARVNYDISRHQANDYVVRSNIDGKVYELPREIGELVTPQTPLAILGRTDRFLLELQVDEQDIARVKTGLPVAITLDSYPGRAFAGRVEKIYPLLDDRSRTFQVDACFVDPPPALYPHLTAEANIILETRQHVMVIPRDYLVEDRYVWAAKDRKKAVQTGLRDYRKVEIRQGLDTSQFIYKPQ